MTTLFKDGVYPIVRFDTNDVSSFLAGSSDHGLTFRRISGFQGRSDQMIKLRGINVYPTAIGIHLGGHPALTGEFVCRAERRGARDELTVVVEVRAGAARAELGPELTALLRQKLGVEVGVELVAPERHGAAHRDRRAAEADPPIDDPPDRPAADVSGLKGLRCFTPSCNLPKSRFGLVVQPG